MGELQSAKSWLSGRARKQLTAGRIIPMRILLLGGGWFLGPAVVTGAVARGWEVTTFTRSRSVAGAHAVHGDRERPEDLAMLAERGPWDAIIDTSASELFPRDVLASARALEQAASRYVYLSTVAVYEGWPLETLTTESAVWPSSIDAGPESERLPVDGAGVNPNYGGRHRVRSGGDLRPRTDQLAQARCHPWSGRVRRATAVVVAPCQARGANPCVR